MRRAGPDTAIVLVSDHGSHSDHLRPKFTPLLPAGITVWHRPQEVPIASGPGLRRDELLHNARLAELLPGRFTPGPAVAACVKPALFRNRGAYVT